MGKGNGGVQVKSVQKEKKDAYWSWSCQGSSLEMFKIISYVILCPDDRMDS